MALRAAFESAADAIARGDAARLADLIRGNAALAHERSTRAHRATLLHYTGANGAEDSRQKTPHNIVAIAQLLLNAGADIDAVAEIYGGSTVLSLAASSYHPMRAGVQIPLLELFLSRGASIDGLRGTTGPILAALRNGRGDAATFLAGRGAKLDLESAAGTGHIDMVRSILAQGEAADDQRAAALAWASQYGHTPVVTALLDSGIDPNAMHEGNTPLHWAAIGAQAKAARILLERGASVRTVNRYGGTPLGQAQWSAVHDEHPSRFDAIVDLLTRTAEPSKRVTDRDR